MLVSEPRSGEAASPPTFGCALPPMLRELTTPAEMAQLLTDPVYYGVGVPRGDGAPIMVIPGFLASDLYLIPLRGWLQRIGYRAYESTLLRNVGCPNLLGRHLIGHLSRIADDTGRQVTLVGHSKGGLLARGIAASRPELVSQVISLGSPFAGAARAHPFTEALVALAREGVKPFIDAERRETCYTMNCGCELVRAFRGCMPDGIPFTSIYSRSDGVVVWQHCLDADSNNNIEVQGTHCGLAFNSQVYRHLGRLLASRRADRV